MVGVERLLSAEDMFLVAFWGSGVFFVLVFEWFRSLEIGMADWWSKKEQDVRKLY